MWNAESEIRKVAEQHGILVEVYDAETTRIMYKRIQRKYAKEFSSGCLWDSLKEYETMSDRQGWKFIGDYVSDEPCVLFCDPCESKKSFMFRNGNNLNTIIENCYCFDFM